MMSICVPCCCPASGELFAVCPIDAHPGVAVEPVSDSSRYFILRLLDPTGIGSSKQTHTCILHFDKRKLYSTLDLFPCY